MIPVVPFPVRAVLTLALKVLVFALQVLAILLDALSDWISPELAECRTSERSEVSSQEPRA